MLLRIPGLGGLVVGGLCQPGGWSRPADCGEDRGRESGQYILQIGISIRSAYEIHCETIPRPPTISTAGLASCDASDESGVAAFSAEDSSAMLVVSSQPLNS